MSQRILLDMVVTLAISSYPVTSAIAMGITTLPQTIAQPANPLQPPEVNAPGTSAPQPKPGVIAPGPFLQPQPRITIPASSAIPITFCSAIKFNVKQKSGFPVTVYLTRPIMDSNGNQLVPVNSLVSAQLKPTREGVKIKAETLVIGGRVVPIQTSVLSVPVLSDIRQEDYYSYEQNPGLPFQVADNLQDWLGNQGILSNGTSDLLGFGLAVASGVTTGLNKPKRTETMEVPEGSTFVFQLLSPVDVPPMVAQVTSANPGQPVSLCSEDAVPTQDSPRDTPDGQEPESDESEASDSEDDY